MEHHLRRTLRIGGENDLPGGLAGIYAGEENRLRVCATDQNKIIEIDTENFTVADYLRFKEPVKDYEKINSNEFVLTDKGIFKL